MHNNDIQVGVEFSPLGIKKKMAAKSYCHIIETRKDTHMIKYCFFMFPDVRNS